MNTKNFDENYNNSLTNDPTILDQNQKDPSSTSICTEENEKNIYALEQLKAQLEIKEDSYKRLYADFENLKKRTAKERISLIYSANEDLLKKIIPILDDFDRALSTTTETETKEDFIAGVKMIHNKFITLLSQLHVEPIKVNPMDDFNPDFHEAITSIPGTDSFTKNKIVEVIEKGYLLNEKILKFAKVVIAT